MRVSFAFALTVCLFNGSLVLAQCNSEELKNKCVPQLANGFNYIASYKIDGAGGSKERIEYSYVFCKGTQYLIDICSPDGTTGIVVSVYDSQRNKVADSKVDNKSVSKLAYLCSSSGVYYMQYTFISSSKSCGWSTLAFKRGY